MATYAIGDLQGCATDFQALLDEIDFDPANDTLWLTGDLINRGPASLDTLRLVYRLGAAAITVLGNHDLHLLAASVGARRMSRSDTIEEILKAPDAKELIDWVRHRPLAHVGRIEGQTFLMVHAGIVPQWSLDTTLRLANEVALELRSARWQTLVHAMYGNQPDRWDEHLEGPDRWRVIINVLTRLRFCQADGTLDLDSKEGAGGGPAGFKPWFDFPPLASRQFTIINGHWSTLGLRLRPDHMALDTGCVWGGRLTAARLEDRQIFSVSCAPHLVPGLPA